MVNKTITTTHNTIIEVKEIMNNNKIEQQNYGMCKLTRSMEENCLVVLPKVDTCLKLVVE